MVAKLFPFLASTPLKPKITITSVTRMDGEMSITFNACPENPYDLGILVDTWKLRVCEKINNSGNIVKQDGLTVLMQLNEAEYNCKGKEHMIFIFISHYFAFS